LYASAFDMLDPPGVLGVLQPSAPVGDVASGDDEEGFAAAVVFVPLVLPVVLLSAESPMPVNLWRTALKLANRDI
jgi:hypothetical protein